LANLIVRSVDLRGCKGELVAFACTFIIRIIDLGTNLA
jgi:hypothetical protein